MTSSDARKILAILATEYPEAYKAVDVSAKVALWSTMFADDDPQDVAMAVRAYIATDTKGFAPKVGQIKAELVKARIAGAPSAVEVWNHIRRAISNSAYNSESEFAKLSPAEQMIAGSPHQLFDWSQMDTATLDSVVASNVQRAYRGLMERESYRMALPATVSQRLATLADRAVGRLTDGE